MRKFGLLASTFFICSILAGFYGIIHDQVTFSVSPEYFTKFKYVQFGLEPSYYGGHRPVVAIIGFLATWWTGLIIGVLLVLTGLVYPDHKMMRAAIKKAIVIVICFAVLAGFAGFIYGKIHLIKTGVNWWLPGDLVDKNSFIIVGSIHNFSYAGGFIGLIISIVYLIVGNKKENHSRMN